MRRALIAALLAFLALPASEKSGLLLHAVVLANRTEEEKQGLMPTNVSDLEQDARNVSLADVVTVRRKTALDLTSFGQTRFEGKVSLDQKSILVLQTPFDRGWHASQDGKVAPMLKVDIGLLGVGLGAGKHNVKLHYRNPLLVPPSIVTFVSFLIVTAGLWRWPRLFLPA